MELFLHLNLPRSIIIIKFGFIKDFCGGKLNSYFPIKGKRVDSRYMSIEQMKWAISLFVSYNRIKLLY